jgi:GntR family carbon starvation induced transcriptional regulator
MREPATISSLTEGAVQQLRREIVTCALEPGEKLRIDVLKKRYGIGASPLREALARLSTLGLVTFESGRGFRVAPMSREDLEDITAMRQIVEERALRRTIESGDDEWEVGVIAAYARLDRAVARHQAADGEREFEIENAHKQFHTSLIAACQSPRLLEAHSMFYDQAQRYRHRMLEQLGDLDEFRQRHRDLMQLVLSRKMPDAWEGLSSHLNLTLHALYAPAQVSRPGAKRSARPRAKVTRPAQRRTAQS